MSEVKVGRMRNNGYTVNFPLANGMLRKYEWAGMKGDRVDIKSVPEEVIEYLMMNTVCFRHGELKIIEETPKEKELIESLGEDKEDYEANSHTKDEVIKLLKGSAKNLESALEKANKNEKMFFVDVAKEIKLDSNSKLGILANSLGMKTELLFSEDE